MSRWGIALAALTRQVTGFSRDPGVAVGISEVRSLMTAQRFVRSEAGARVGICSSREV
jgi:hypothetical protein